MRSTFTLCAFIAAALFGCKASSAEAADTRLATARRIADAILAAQIEANGVPGMGAAIWRDGDVVWSGSAGQADRETGRPVDADTVFRLASVSKLFAATAVAKLRQEGRLDAEASVRSILPWLPKQWSAISTIHLAAHLSGLPHYQEVDDDRGARAFTSTREAAGLLQNRKLLSQPGTRYEYSTWGYTLLSVVVERAAGVPYLDYLAAQITPGLKIGADRTGKDPNASIAYAFSDDGRTVRAAPHDYSYSWGGAGLSARMPDLARWGGRVIEGKIVSPATVEWMLTPARLANGSEVREGAYAVGLGWRTQRDIDGRLVAHHAGIAEGARSILMLYPAQKLSVSLASNASWTSTIEQTAQMIAAPFLVSTNTGPCPVRVGSYHGKYDSRSIAGSASFTLRDGICMGRIGIGSGNAFGAWLNGFPQRDVSELTIIGVDPDGGGGRAALVTPVGTYDLRSTGGHRFEAALGGKSTLSLNFQ
jgi:serine beta-lactamase-like protein LACTB, mitochondrial